MKHTIVLDFKKPNLGIDVALKEITEYQKWVERKEEELCRRLAELGSRLADMEFANYPYERDGNNRDFAIYPIPTENGWKISAYGEDIAFIEFGAGTMATNKTYKSENGTITTYPGSWSIDHAQKFFNNGYWYYRGVRYTYIVPGNCMGKVSKELRNRVSELAREVFASD